MKCAKACDSSRPKIIDTDLFPENSEWSRNAIFENGAFQLDLYVVICGAIEKLNREKSR